MSKTQLPEKMGNNTKIVKLSNPLIYDNQEINEITLREPMGGDLRGIGGLMRLIQMESDAVGKVLSRVSSPMIDQNTFESMSVKDIFSISSELASFLAD